MIRSIIALILLSMVLFSSCTFLTSIPTSRGGARNVFIEYYPAQGGQLAKSFSTEQDYLTYLSPQ